MDEGPAGELDGRPNAEQFRVEQAAPNRQEETGGGAEGEEEPWWKEWVGLLVRAGFWALLIYLFVFQVSLVDGPSMNPNFQDFDKLVIDKLTYRFSSVRRFDVIVFEAIDLDKSPRQARDYIKRVVGRPNEKVEIHDNCVWIDGRKLEECFPHEPYSHYGETGPGDGKKFVVPPGHYFEMGDNRGGSHDSRSTGMGFVPVGQIKGLVRIRWWPSDRMAWFSRGTE